MDSIWTIKRVLNRIYDSFQKKGISSFKIDAEILVSHVLNIDRSKLFIDPDRLLLEKELNKIEKAVQRRIKYEPVAYITGHKNFFNLSYLVNKNVLIPRPETELLVEEILKYDLKGKSVLDIGAGCGNIGITIKKYVSESKIICSDISHNALKVAIKNKNLLLNGNHIEFVQSDVYSDISDTYDFIISNPPYVLAGHIRNLQNDVKNYEPVIALDGGKDGMCFYNKIVTDIKEYLNPGGFLFLEINPLLKEEILSLLKKGNLSLVKIKNDYDGYDRVIIAKNND